MNFEDSNPQPPEFPQSSGLPGEIEPGTSGVPLVGQEFPPAAAPSLPEDLRAPWGWFDVLLFVLVALFGALAVGFLLLASFAAFGVRPGQIQKSVSEGNFFIILNQAFLSVLLLAYLAAHLRFRFEVPFWRTIGWRPLDTGKTPRGVAYLTLILGGFVLSIFVQLVSAAFGTKTKMPIETLFQDRRSALLLMLMGVLLAPVVEETIFRGYIYPVLARSFGVAAGVLTTGTLFGLLHARQLWGGWVQIGMLIFVGIVFTGVRALTRTVLASFVLHVSYNSFLFLAFIVASHGLRSLPKGH